MIAGQTPYELIAGHAYNAKLCEFGCPIMVYVGDSVKQKTDAKWRTGIFLGKVLTNDMYLTSVAGTLKLTRSIKAIFPKWEDHMEDYRQVPCVSMATGRNHWQQNRADLARFNCYRWHAVPPIG